MALPTKRKRKQPVRFTERNAAKVLAVLAEGGTVKDASRALRLGRHGHKTTWRWARQYPEFESAISEAKAIGTIAMSERTAEIADELLSRARAGELEQAEVPATKEWLGHMRFLMVRWNPKRFGSEARGSPVAVKIETTLDLGKAATRKSDPYTLEINPSDDA